MEEETTFQFQELTELTGIKPYVLRYWESEFTDINPIVSSTGDKIYSQSDLEVLLKIKKLLFEDKLTINEAKYKLRPESLQELTVKDEPSSPRFLKLRLDETLLKIKEFKSKYRW